MCSCVVLLKLIIFYSEIVFIGFMFLVLIDIKNGLEVWIGGVVLLGFVDLVFGFIEFVIVFFGCKYGFSVWRVD